jgi:hypothetical protein
MIPADLQEALLASIRGSVLEMVRQKHGVEEESTTGFGDDLEALRAELNQRNTEKITPHVSEPRAPSEITGGHNQQTRMEIDGYESSVEDCI